MPPRPSVSLVADPATVRAALSPLRRQLLGCFVEPTSASAAAATLGLPRQRVGYHVRALEAAGLLLLVEECPRRGFTERVLQTTASALVVDPAVLTLDERTAFTAVQDRHAAEHLVAVAGATVRDVARMQAAAEAAGRRLLTFTVEAEVRFERPDDVHDFTDAVAAAIAETAARFHTAGGRPYRVVVGGHPAPAPAGPDAGATP